MAEGGNILRHKNGRLTGNKRLETEEAARQVKGTMQSNAGNAKRNVGETLRA